MGTGSQKWYLLIVAVFYESGIIDGRGHKPSLPLVLTKADNHFWADDIRRGKNIDDFQTARFGNTAGGVGANSKEGAIAIALQTFVEQQFDFLLREYFGLPVSLDLHAGVYTRPADRVKHTYCITASVWLIS